MNLTLESKLRQLDEYNERLRYWLDKPRVEEWDEALELALERLIQLVIECAADAGDLWLGEHGKPPGQNAGGVFRNLQQANVIDQSTYQRFRGYVRSRNRIIHDYDVITAEEVRRDAEGVARDIPVLIQALLRS